MHRTSNVAIIMCAALLAAGSTFAQNTYLAFHAGYGFGAGTQVLGISRSATSFDGVYGSLGEGALIGVSVGHMFTDNFGIELGISDWPGASYEFTDARSAANTPGNLEGSGWVFSPSVVISSGGQTVSPYARMGVVLGIMKVKNRIIYTDFYDLYDETWEETGGLALGYTGAAGVVFSTGAVVDVFIEAAAHLVTYSPSKEEMVRYYINGSDALRWTQNRSYTLEESIPITSSGTTDLAQRRPFSNIALSAGLRINL